MQLINKQDLMKLGYKEHTARSLICQAKKIMLQQGYSLYNNKRLGLVPTETVESIIGVKLYTTESDVVEHE